MSGDTASRKRAMRSWSARAVVVLLGVMLGLPMPAVRAEEAQSDDGQEDAGGIPASELPERAYHAARGAGSSSAAPAAKTSSHSKKEKRLGALVGKKKKAKKSRKAGPPKPVKKTHEAARRASSSRGSGGR